MHWWLSANSHSAAEPTMSHPKWGTTAGPSSRNNGGVDAAAPQPAEGGERRRGITGVGGTMIMKSVSLFLANGRRASKSNSAGGQVPGRNKARGNMTLDGSTDATQRPRRRRSQAIEDSSGKINPKLLETYKKKTHFSK